MMSRHRTCCAKKVEKFNTKERCIKLFYNLQQPKSQMKPIIILLVSLDLGNQEQKDNLVPLSLDVAKGAVLPHLDDCGKDVFASTEWLSQVFRTLSKVQISCQEGWGACPCTKEKPGAAAGAASVGWREICSANHFQSFLKWAFHVQKCFLWALIKMETWNKC